jgi:hypothetical protein
VQTTGADFSKARLPRAWTEEGRGKQKKLHHATTSRADDAYGVKKHSELFVLIPKCEAHGNRRNRVQVVKVDLLFAMPAALGGTWTGPQG